MSLVQTVLQAGQLVLHINDHILYFVHFMSWYLFISSPPQSCKTIVDIYDIPYTQTSAILWKASFFLMSPMPDCTPSFSYNIYQISIKYAWLQGAVLTKPGSGILVIPASISKSYQTPCNVSQINMFFRLSMFKYDKNCVWLVVYNRLWSLGHAQH